ncbi:uncharacterized protein LOC144114607 [Amblyomma americanum]
MLARSELAALHYNENAGRVQCRTTIGRRQWAVKHPKAWKGNPVACPVKEPATFGYVEHLPEIVDELVESGSFGATHVTTLPQPPPPLTSSFGPVDKAALVRDHLSRFESREEQGRHTERCQ